MEDNIMKNRFYFWLAACLVLLLGISFSVPAKSDDSSRAGFTEADAEYYLPDDVFFFFRPGLEFELISFEIPGDLQPLVTFKVTDPGGYPLDIIDGGTVFQSGATPVPAPVDVRFMLSYIPVGEEQKVTYHMASRGRDRGGEYTSLGGGEFTYKFATVLPADYEADATHTLVSAPRREFDDYPELIAQGVEEDYYDSNIYNFVPSGASDPMPRDIVTTATCNRCHLNSLNMDHGTRYQHPQACQNCHNPEYMGARDAPERVLNVMVHEIHSSNLVDDGEVHEVHYPAEIIDCEVCHTGGAPTDDLPLVANPNPVTTCDGSGVGMTTLHWADVGTSEIRLDSTDGKLFAMSNGAGSQDTGNWVRDGREFYLLDADGEFLDREKVNLTVYGCADNPPYDYGSYLTDADGDLNLAMLHSNWLTRPQRGACGGCHTNINWETGEGHAAGPQEDDEFCSFCHQADSGNEFDRSVKGAHTVPLASEALAGVYVDIKSVTNAGPGQRPTVVFSLLSKDGRINPATLDRLLFTLTGPNEDFEFYAQENVLSGLTAVGNDWSYTFAAMVPSTAKGSYSVGFEGRITTEVNGDDERDSAENYIVPAAVTDAAADARRVIVDDAKCEACHSNLSLHGDNRKNATMYCQTCHRPDATDERVRLEGLDESIHFKYMIHKIHRGAELVNQPYIIYGYRSSLHDYSDVHFPGDLRECEMCHVNDSYELPIAEGALPTHAPSALITEMLPITAACLSCHDSDGAAVHADSNTSDLGEACETCHGEGKSYAVSRVHAR
jgi:hypothetical protein